MFGWGKKKRNQESEPVKDDPQKKADTKGGATPNLPLPGNDTNTDRDDVKTVTSKTSSSADNQSDSFEKLQRECMDLIRRQSEAEETIVRLRQESTSEIQRLRAESEEQRRHEIERILSEATDKHKEQMKQRLVEMEKQNEKALKTTIDNTTKRVSAATGKTLKVNQEEIKTLKAQLAERDEQMKELQDKLSEEAVEERKSQELWNIAEQKQLSEQLKDKEDSLDAAIAEVEFLRGRLEKSEEEVRQLQEENEQLKLQYDQLNEDFQQHREQPQETCLLPGEPYNQLTPEGLEQEYKRLLESHMQLKAEFGQLKVIADMKRQMPTSPPPHGFSSSVDPDDPQIQPSHFGVPQRTSEEPSDEDNDEEHEPQRFHTAVQSTNMTDTEKVEQLEKQLEQYREESTKLREELDRLRDPEQEATLDRLRKNFLKVHDEKMELLENLKAKEKEMKRLSDKKKELLVKLEARDEDIKQLRTQNQEDVGGDTYPSITHSLSVDGIPSPDDPRAEVVRLKEVIEEKDKKIESLEAQTRSFQHVASEREKLQGHSQDQSRTVMGLRKELEQTKEEIRVIREGSKSAEQIESLKMKLKDVQKKLTAAEHAKTHLENEVDIWKQKVDGERENIGQLKGQLASFHAQRRSHSHDSYQQELAEREVAVGHVETRQNLVEAELIALRGDVAQREKDLAVVDRENVVLKQRYEEVSDAHDELQQKYHSMVQQLETLDRMKTQMQAFRGNVSTLTAKVKENEERTKVIQDELEVSKHQALQYKEEFERERKDREDAAGHHEEEVANLQVAYHEIEKELQQRQEVFLQTQKVLNKEITTTNRDKELLEKSLKEEMAELQRESEEILKQTQEALDEQVAKLNHDITELKEENIKQRNTFELARAESEHHIAQLTKQLEITGTAKAEFENHATDLAVDLEQAKDIAQILTVEKQSLEEKIEDIDRDRRAKVKSLEIALNEKAALNEHLERVQEEIVQVKQQMEHTVQESSVELMGKNQQVKQFRKQVEQITGHLQTTRGELERVKGQLLQTQASMQEQVQFYDVQLKEMESMAARLREELERSRVTVQHYESQVQWYREQLQKRNEPTVGDELAPYRLHFQDPLPANRQVGSGCYGTVYAVEIDGIQCIAKRVQDILLGERGQEAVRGDQRRAFEEKFRQECILLSKIRHPNIVQFMGVRYGRDMYDLTLVMERLPMDLQKCLERCQADGYFIPLSIRFSILVDVTYGLLHLHNLSILHRDLTAGNILLTSNLRAKIADLGVSRIYQSRYSQKLSKIPGTMGYMPPEALKDNPEYNIKLDNFSFGVLALFVALQEFPEFSWEHVPDFVMTKGESELYKRRKWMSKIGERHFLYPLIHQCLQDNSTARPSTMELNAMMKELSGKFPRRLQDLTKMLTELNKLGMIAL